jgi:hypothetical protein
MSQPAFIPGPGTLSSSSSRSTSAPFGTNAATTGRLSAVRRVIRGGLSLFEQLASRAPEEGYSTLRAHVLAINQRSIAMLRRAGFAPRGGGGILREYELRFPRTSSCEAQGLR